MNFRNHCYCFFTLLDTSPKVKRLLEIDTCYMIADKYHLATVFYIFLRARFYPMEFTDRSFHIALYLSHEIHEEDTIARYKIRQNALTDYYVELDCELFMQQRLHLFFRINSDILVDREVCDILFQTSPHPVWERTRREDHGGVIRNFYCECCNRQWH